MLCYVDYGTFTVKTAFVLQSCVILPALNCHEIESISQFVMVTILQFLIVPGNQIVLLLFFYLIIIYLF